MNNSTTSQFMDKQIMDLSNSNSSSNTDFMDLIKLRSEKKNEIIPSYDFMPIRPAGGSSSPPPPATRSSIFDSGDEDPPVRAWNSLDSKTNTLRNYSSLDVDDDDDDDEPAKLTLGNKHKPVNASLDASLISEIDRIIKKHTDNLMHAMDDVSSRVTQMETRTRNLEHLVADLKVSVENIHGDNDGKMRQLENILREVQTGVQCIRDKQEIAEAHFPKVEQVRIQNTPQTAHTQPTASPPPQQNYQLPPTQQYPQNQVPPDPQQESYFPKHRQNPVNPSQQYHLPPPQQPHHPPPSNQYPPPHQTPFSQPLPPYQPHPSFSTVNSSLQPPSSQHLEEMSYSPSSRVQPHPSQQFYGPPPNIYEPPSSRPGPGYSGLFGPSSGNMDSAYPYGSSVSSHGSGSPMKQPFSSVAMGQGGGSGFGQLPTAQILPQALPTASGVGGGSGSGGSGNKVPIDDVVDKVTTMGFPRDLVRATVRKLTENGQAVDLNVVLDKLMNDGDGQGPRAWYGR